ncbi:MAG TPA: SufS family cysteine desulfurase [Candidatus Babeliales bacterium]|nr:SufS family cysteine desulfurase [Candidatus Babeliales bacterium]
MKNIRSDFPILCKLVEQKPLIYFDNAATTQKPQAVIDAIVDFYSTYNANVGRSTHTLGERATMMYEAARSTVAHFINAATPAGIVFTSGTTESINLVADAWGRAHIKAGDEIVISELEHHANLLTWQRLASQVGAKLRYIPVSTTTYTLDLTGLSHLITEKTKLVAVSHVSNFFGSQQDIAAIIARAHAVGAKVLIDAAQSVGHQLVDVQLLKPDFLAFSGHKMFGPTGIGVLYVAAAMHDQMAPYHVGGGMVYEADWHTATFLPMSQRLEAGTPAIAQAVGLAAAITYINEHINFDVLQKHEASLSARLIDGLQVFDRITIIGPIGQLRSIGHLVSFVVDGIHAHDVAAYLSQRGIAVRAGHHCAQPLAKKLGIAASVRASFHAYNTMQEVDRFLAIMHELLESNA